MQMKKFLALIILAVALSGSAQKDRDTRELTLPGIPQSSVKITEVTAPADKMPMAATAQRAKAKQKQVSSEENTVKATLLFPTIGGEEGWSMPYLSVSVYNGEGYYDEIVIEPYDEEWNVIPTNSWDFEIPAGTYDFLSVFSKINPNNIFGSDPDVYYIKEKVTISEGRTVELKPEESTICLKMETTNPDGEKSRFRKISYDEDWNYEILEEGNITDAYLTNLILFNDEVVAHLTSNAGGLVVVPGPAGEFDAQDNCNFYVNEVSDRYVFRQIRLMPAWPEEEKGTYMAVLECKGAKEGTYTNDPLYRLDDSDINGTPATDLYPTVDDESGPAHPYGISYRSYDKGSLHWTGRMLQSTQPYLWRLYISGPSRPVSEGDLYFAYEKVFNDAYIPVQDEWGEYYYVSSLTSSSIFPFAKDGSTLTTNAYGIPANNPNDEMFPISPFPGNPAFQILSDNIKLETGSSAPLLNSYICPQFNWETENMENNFNYYYTGRLNELIESTSSLATGSLEVDGKTVATTLADVQSWMSANQDRGGTYEFKLSTDNFETDGLKGGNTAVVTFNNSGTDTTPPSATMLQLRNTAGEATQTFATPEETNILLAAADFTVCTGEPYEYGEKPVWFEVSEPAKVSAWCKPYGYDTADDIELVIDPEGFYSHGFGALYRADLASLSTKSPTGWYDLTISVEDAAGNRQVQTLSPAFKIATLTGVPDVTAGSYIRIEGNSITAPAGSHAYTVSGIETRLTSLPAGIYIVKTPSQTAKVVIK